MRLNRGLRQFAILLVCALVLVGAAVGLASASASTQAAVLADADGDGVDDSVDNCVGAFNPDQRNFDNDGQGDRCDTSAFPASHSEVMFYPRNQSGQALPAQACFHFQWSANANVNPKSGDGCTSTWFYYFYDTPGGVPGDTYTLTLTQTSPPSGCTGGLTSPYTFVFGPGRYAAVDIFYSCPAPPPPPPPPPPAAPVSIEEPGQNGQDLPAQPNVTEPGGSVIVEVKGNGTIVQTSGAARTTQADDQVGARIRCGLTGAVCYTERAPEDKVRMRAQPGAGYSFGGWTGACTGRAEICAVTASAAATVGANFVPQRRGRAVSVQLRKPRIKARFTQSAGSGTLTVNGSITAAARLRFQLRRPGGGPLLSRNVRVQGGPFGFRATLKRGTLLRGAALFPGGFVLSVTGQAGRIGVPLQMRTIVVKAPAEGVVRRVYASTSPGGRATATLPAGSKEAWAIFRFASQPTAEPLTVTWYQPNGTVVGSKQKNNRPTIQTGIGNTAGIPSGTWRVELSAGGKLVKRFTVRIG